MSTEQTIQALWQLHEQGDFQPQAWRGKLDAGEGYRVQLGLLDRKLARGARQVGWKVGLTAAHMRELFGSREPVFGHLLQSGSAASGSSFRCAELRSPAVESELMIVMARDLSGPSATAQDAQQAIGTISAALELVELGRADMRVDLPLAIADNVAQRAFIHGEAIPWSSGFDFGEVRAAVSINGQLKADVLGRDVIDNQLQTLAWLANALHRYGRRLQAGQCVMTGSFTKPLPVQASDKVETRFSGVGVVQASFT